MHVPPPPPPEPPESDFNILGLYYGLEELNARPRTILTPVAPEPEQPSVPWWVLYAGFWIVIIMFFIGWMVWSLIQKGR